PHRVADLHGPARELVELGRLARQAAPMRHLQVAERKQAFQVLEGNRPMNTSLTRYVLDAPWLAIGIEPEKDVAPREVAERPQGAFHVPSHSPQHRTRMEGMSAADTEIGLPKRLMKRLIMKYHGRAMATARPPGGELR